jgi:iron complex transport system substrate-binding protein
MRLKFAFAFLLASCCAFCLSACRGGSAGEGRGGVTVQDATGQTVTVSDTSRIVSIGPATTETIYALGVGSRLVGVDNSSAEYLPQAAPLPKVGPRTTLNAEGIISLKPTLIMMPMDAGPPQVIDQLKSSAIPVIQLSPNYNFKAVQAKITLIAHALGQEAKGAELNSSIDAEIFDIYKLMDRALKTPKVLFVGRAQNMPNATMSGTGTTIDEMIKMAGGQNAITGFQGFKEMTDEAVVNAEPDIILITQGSFERSGGVDGVLKFPGVALTPAGRNRQIIPVSDMYFQGFGPGVGKALRELVVKFHPEVSAGQQGDAAAASSSPAAAVGDRR